jgi:hypothetical protein
VVVVVVERVALALVEHLQLMVARVYRHLTQAHRLVMAVVVAADKVLDMEAVQL